MELTESFQTTLLPSHISTEVVAGWAAEFNLDKVDIVRVDEDSGNAIADEYHPELSVNFKVDKPKEEMVDKLFDKPYQVSHLQNSKLLKTAKKKVKRERKKMDKFSDMFENALNMDIDMASDDEMNEVS